MAEKEVSHYTLNPARCPYSIGKINSDESDYHEQSKRLQIHYMARQFWATAQF